jgi:acylphosphatase
MTGQRARIRIIVSGRVQGVFFRQATAEQARSLRINGSVRNLNDGSVEIIAEGDRCNLEILLAWAHQGPPSARVDAVEESWRPCEDEFVHFRVR